jgi:hypothetical protein
MALHAVGLLEIELQAALVAIDLAEYGRESRLVAGPAMAGIVTRARVFDLNDIGTHVGQVHAAHGTGQQPGQVEDTNSAERLTAHSKKNTKQKNTGTVYLFPAHPRACLKFVLGGNRYTVPVFSYPLFFLQLGFEFW